MIRLFDDVGFVKPQSVECWMGEQLQIGAFTTSSSTLDTGGTPLLFPFCMSSLTYY